jgi:hypothetical protein
MPSSERPTIERSVREVTTVGHRDGSIRSLNALRASATAVATISNWLAQWSFPSAPAR